MATVTHSEKKLTKLHVNFLRNTATEPCNRLESSSLWLVIIKTLLSGPREEKKEKVFDLFLMLVRINGAPGKEGQQEPSLKRAFVDSNIFIFSESAL